MPYIQAQLKSRQRIDVVWDTYQPNSLKTGTREKKCSGNARRHVAPKVKILPNWNSFLRVDNNKKERFGQEVRNIQAADKEAYWAHTVSK